MRRGLVLLIVLVWCSVAQAWPFAHRVTWLPSAHPLNNRVWCQGWWIVTPTPLATHARWLDMLSRRVGTLENMGSGQFGTSGLLRMPTAAAPWGSVGFDGTNDSVSTAQILDNPATMSLSAWVKTTRITRQGIVTKRVVYNSTTPGWYLRTHTGGSNAQFGFWMVQVAGSTEHGIYGGASIADGRWHHVVATVAQWANPGTNWALWVDGVKQAPTVFNLGTITTLANSEPLRFGGFGNGSDPFDGELNDIRVYNRVLTDAEIRLLWRAPQTGYAALLQPARLLIGVGSSNPRQGMLGVLAR